MEDLLRKLEPFVKENTKYHDVGHDWNHSMDVYRNAMDIASHERIEPRWLPLITIAACLHDVCDHKFKGSISRQDMINFINTLVDDVDTNLIMKIIDNISYSKEIRYGIDDFGSHRILRDIVSDADKIQALGQIGIERCFIYRQDVQDKEEKLRDILQHCNEKLLKLKDEFIHTARGKELATPGHEVIVRFSQSASRFEKIAPRS